MPTAKRWAEHQAHFNEKILIRIFNLSYKLANKGQNTRTKSKEEYIELALAWLNKNRAQNRRPARGYAAGKAIYY